jgi:TetR/AcrR family transcriptional repressor of nem operon
MLVNSAIEGALHDTEFFDVVAVFLDEVERFLFRCVSKGQKDRTITKTHSAGDLSKSLLGILLGIRVLARVRPGRKLLEGLLRPAFALLDNTPSAQRRRTAW